MSNPVEGYLISTPITFVKQSKQALVFLLGSGGSNEGGGGELPPSRPTVGQLFPRPFK